jgi:hypothetical protein
MQKSIIVVALAAVSACACHASAPPQIVGVDEDVRVAAGRTYRWSFDDSPGTPGTGAPRIASHPRIFVPVLGRWRVDGDENAVSLPNVYRQGGRYDASESPRVVVSDLVFDDIAASVRCRPESGRAGGSCGLMFAVAEADDYLVVRADGGEGVIKLLHVGHGREDEIVSLPATVTTNAWHTLGLTTHDGVVNVSWDGAAMFTARTGLDLHGKVGLATRADAVTAFDDLEVRAGG